LHHVWEKKVTSNRRLRGVQKFILGRKKTLRKKKKGFGSRARAAYSSKKTDTNLDSVATGKDTAVGVMVL